MPNVWLSRSLQEDTRASKSVKHICCFRCGHLDQRKRKLHYIHKADTIRFEQDRTWLMLGMAIRMATDLNLHRKSMVSGLDTEGGRARDLEVSPRLECSTSCLYQIINRERTWLLCFILDRSISAQMGKPYTLREDYIIRNACEASWHLQRFSLPADRALAAYVVLQQIMSRAIDSIYSSTQTVSGLRNDCDCEYHEWTPGCR